MYGNRWMYDMTTYMCSAMYVCIIAILNELEHRRVELAKARADVKELKAKMDAEEDEDEVDDMFVEWKQVCQAYQR